MPAHRLPALKARVTGADAKNPGRFKARAEPKVAPVGRAPAHLTAAGKRAWQMFVRRMPWLSASDEAMLGIASMIQGQIADREEVGVAKLNLFQSVLSKLGASPTDRSKVLMPDDDEEEEDEFFGTC